MHLILKLLHTQTWSYKLYNCANEARGSNSYTFLIIL